MAMRTSEAWFTSMAMRVNQLHAGESEHIRGLIHPSIHQFYGHQTIAFPRNYWETTAIEPDVSPESSVETTSELMFDG
jgi:hypothetical protein